MIKILSCPQFFLQLPEAGQIEGTSRGRWTFLSCCVHVELWVCLWLGNVNDLCILFRLYMTLYSFIPARAGHKTAFRFCQHTLASALFFVEMPQGVCRLCEHLPFACVFCLWSFEVGIQLNDLVSNAIRWMNVHLHNLLFRHMSLTKRNTLHGHTVHIVGGCPVKWNFLLL